MSPRQKAQNARLLCTTAGFTRLRLYYESFAVSGPLALLGSAFYLMLVHRLADYDPRFLPTLDHLHALALPFVRCDQLKAGLAPAGGRPCWAHKTKARRAPSWTTARRQIPPSFYAAKFLRIYATGNTCKLRSF